MRLIPSAVLFAITAGCDSGSFQGELKPCPCADGGCSEEACPIEVAIDPGCEGQFELAEVLIGEHVESAAVRPSEQRCETPRETRVVRLQCVESP
jgi:hypothetical protein